MSASRSSETTTTINGIGRGDGDGDGRGDGNGNGNGGGMNPLRGAFVRAAQLNNAGVAALCRGDDTTAIVLLTSSIRMMKSELSKPGTDAKNYYMRTSTERRGINDSSYDDEDMMDDEDCDVAGQTSSSSFTPTETVPLASSSSLASTGNGYNDVDEDDDDDDDYMNDGGVMFNQAITIPSDGTNSSGVDINIYTAAVVFNLALAHQQQAAFIRRSLLSVMRRGGNGSTSSSTSGNGMADSGIITQDGAQKEYGLGLQKAERLYQIIITLLDDHIACRSCTGVLVKLAAINNLSSIRMKMAMGSGPLRPVLPAGGGNTSVRDEERDRQMVQDVLGRFLSENLGPLQACIENDPAIHGLLMNFLLFRRAPFAAAAA